MHLRTILLSAVATGAVVLAGCGPVDDTGNGGGEATGTPSPTISAGPTPSPSPPPATARDDQDDAGNQDDGPAGDCAAYVDSDSWCEDGIGDYDCEGGSGNGPNYAPRNVEVVEPGIDPFGLDRNNDGEGCEGSAPAEPAPPPPASDTDPRFDTCGDAIDAGYGPYYRGEDPEYDWYRDADSDGVVCE